MYLLHPASWKFAVKLYLLIPMYYLLTYTFLFCFLFFHLLTFTSCLIIFFLCVFYLPISDCFLLTSSLCLLFVSSSNVPPDFHLFSLDFYFLLSDWFLLASTSFFHILFSLLLPPVFLFFLLLDFKLKFFVFVSWFMIALV